MRSKQRYELDSGGTTMSSRPTIAIIRVARVTSTVSSYCQFEAFRLLDLFVGPYGQLDAVAPSTLVRRLATCVLTVLMLM